MGTWLGHIAPGSFFVSFSLWWLVRTLHNYFIAPSRHRNSLIQHCCCKRGCCSRLPLDNWLLIMAAVIGVIMEIATSMANEGGKVVMGNRQHLTMYISFGLVGLVSILVHYRVKFIPKGAEYMTFMMALIVEMVLFAFHLHGRDEVDKHIHMLLVYTIAGCIVATALELQFPESINAALARHFLTLVQGTWFIQIGFTLYPPNGIPKWDLEDMENIMLITLIYSWHLIGCLMILLILSGLTYWCCSPKCRGEYDGDAAVNLLPVYNGYKDGKGAKANSPAVMNGYNSVASDDESELFTAPGKSVHH